MKVQTGISLFLAAVLSVCIRWTIQERSMVSFLTETTAESQEFREQYLPVELFDKIQEKTVDAGERTALLTDTMLLGKFYPRALGADGTIFRKYKKEEYEKLRDAYGAVWGDVKYFPVAGEQITFENSWLASRTYGGDRFHEGTDLSGPVEKSGYYPVVSMTDGRVEKIGWLNLGGYRIGIRSPSGGYFYYAHLSSYDREFQIGEWVEAGELLGFMGDTGYGTEGTRGQFPVHLHIGIYIRTAHFPEMSVNPYWVLRALEKNRIRQWGL